MRQDASPNERKEASKSAAIEAAAGAGAARKLSDRAKRQSDASWHAVAEQKQALAARAGGERQITRRAVSKGLQHTFRSREEAEKRQR